MKKLLSIILTICMLTILTLTPVHVNAETVPTVTEQPTETENIESGGIATETQSEPEVWQNPLEENIYTKIVDNGDGTQTATLYDHPVRFVNEEGRLQDISLEIASDSDGNFKTLAAESQTVFPKTISDGITLSGNGVSLKMTPAKPFSSGKLTASTESFQTLSSAVTKIDNQKVAYTYDSKTTLEYQLTYTGFKEDIVVSEYTGQTEYTFVLETNGLTLTKIDESYYLTDEKGEIKATIGDIIIFTADERNNTLGSMTHTVVKENELYILTIHVDADYLKDEKTKYPIRIDPTVEINYDNNGAGAIEDVTICSNGSYSGTSGSLYVGNSSDKGARRVLIKFPGLDFSSLGNIDVQSAYVEIRDIMCESTELGLEARIFMGNNWSESNTNTWEDVEANSSADLYAYNYVSYATGNALSPKHRYSFEITTAVRGWKSGFYSQDKGIIIRAIEESDLSYSNTYIYKTFASYNRASNKPSLVINYVDYDNPEPPYGWLDWVTSTYISGWAYRPDIPNTVIDVKLRLVNTSINKTYNIPPFKANQYRSDVQAAGFGNGAHGFTYSINWNDYLPGAYEVFAYAECGDGTWAEIHGGPKTYENEGIALDQYNLSLVRGNKAVLNAYLYESIGMSDSVTFQSSDSNIVLLEKKSSKVCHLTAQNSGTVTIYAISESGNYKIQCTVTVLKSAIIVVPGIMGTELALAYDQNGLSAGTKVWPPLASSASFSDEDDTALAKLFSLECTDTGTSKYDLIVYNDDNYGTYDMYKELYDNLTESYNSKHDIIFFGYDWRQSNAVSGDLLSDRVNQYDKVIIVAHSMGGLVASHMLTNTSARAKVINFISIATPFLGTPGTHLLVSHGEYSVFDETLNMYWPTDSVVKEILQRLAVNIPSVYELYPTEKYFSFGNGGYLSLKTHLGYTTHYNTFSDTRDNLIYATNGHMNGVFNNDLFDEATDNHELLWIGEEHITSYVNSYYICGTSYKTINHVLINMNIMLDDSHDETEVEQGDSVVISCSASINDLYYSRTFYTALTHNDLLKGNGVEFVKQLINNNTDLLGGFYNNESDVPSN